MQSSTEPIVADLEKMKNIADDMQSTIRFILSTTQQLGATACHPDAFGRLGDVVARVALDQVHPQLASTFDVVHSSAQLMMENLRASRQSYTDGDITHAGHMKSSLRPVAGMPGTMESGELP
ncbi:hypothetical protein ACQP2F_15575 [Actinoplanes sp. CA-030573]|uniref:hypothetical protein n=1 Tax=Actinoplanes sp. CA-030573 TaxID=3239898 RepID=UPI003D8D7DDE